MSTKTPKVPAAFLPVSGGSSVLDVLRASVSWWNPIAIISDTWPIGYFSRTRRDEPPVLDLDCNTILWDNNVKSNYIANEGISLTESSPSFPAHPSE